MSISLEQAVAVIPRLRTPIQLAALAFTIVSVALIKRVDPDNFSSLAVAGAIGIGCLVIPLAFHRSLLQLIPETQRAWFLLGILVVILLSFGGLALHTAKTIMDAGPKPEGPRFDTELQPDQLKIFPNGDGSARLQVGIRFFPLSEQAGEGATVIAGVVTVHDEQEIAQPGVGRVSSEPCSAVKSCMGAIVLKNFETNPMLVRSGSPGFTHALTVDVRRVPKQMRIWWEFYQREGHGNAICRYDYADLRAPADGIKPLALFRGEVKVADFCYRSSGQRSLAGY